MADVSPFEVDRGDAQARVASTTIAGAYAFQLGHAARIIEYMDIGNYVELSQSAEFDFGFQKLVRLSATLVAPEVAVAGRAWVFTAALDGVVFYTRTIAANGCEVTMTDIALSLASAPAPPGTAEVTFRLTLAAA